MPFAQVQYRSLVNSPLDWQARRQRYLCITITYTVFFLIVAFVFLGLYINERNELNRDNCQDICAAYGTTFDCGYQQCCDSAGGGNSNFYNSYQFCLGDYAQTIFFIVMIIAFVYSGYEIFLIICTLCTAPIFRPQQQVVVTQQPMIARGQNLIV